MNFIDDSGGPIETVFWADVALALLFLLFTAARKCGFYPKFFTGCIIGIGVIFAFELAVFGLFIIWNILCLMHDVWEERRGDS